MSERNLYEVTGDIKDINTLLVSREEWNRRAQPAQAGPITSETGNTQKQGASAITSESAQAGQVLTRDDILDAWMAVMHIAHATQRQEAFARAIEQAVLAKRVPVVPKCACCGTTENLHADYGSGGPWRCSSPDCMVF